jgi:DNA invertase Pin-like site-specific DNA recombinase
VRRPSSRWRGQRRGWRWIERGAADRGQGHPGAGLHARGIGVRILTGKLSGSYSPAGEGKFFFTMMAAFAELERDIIYERTMAGLAAAKAQGRTGGRPTVMDADKLAAARARRERGESPAKIARALGVSRASVYRHLAAESE